MAQTLTLDRHAAPDDEQDTLIESVSDPLVARAAQHLIMRHRMGQRFDIEALDVPHEALASVSVQLEEAGLSHALSEPFVEALRHYIMNYGGSFSRAANAKPVRIHMVVTDRMPKSRFDEAMTELACLGPQEVRVEGATRVNVRATPSGTATSSNAANIDAMYMNVRGLYLWVRFEAPTKQDLDGLMTDIESTLAGIAQSVGGDMGAAEFKQLLETLQQNGMMTPAVTAIVNKMIQIQNAVGKDGRIALSAAELGELLKDFGTLMDKSQGMIPPALVAAMMQSMGDMAAAHPAIAEFLSEKGYEAPAADNDNVSVEERIEAILENIAELAALEGIDPALAAALAEMIEKAQADLKNAEVTPATLLETLSEKLGAMAARGDIPQALFDGIGAVLPEIAALRESPEVAGAPADLTQGEALLAMLEDVAAKIEKGEVDIDALPPELQALIEKMGGVETILQKEGREARVEALAEAIDAKGADAELSIAVHAAVLALANPENIAALPAPVQAVIENFITQNPEIVERAATHSVLRDMTATLEGADPDSPEAAEIKNTIEALKAEGIAALLARDPALPVPPSVRYALPAFVPPAVLASAGMGAMAVLTQVLPGLKMAGPAVAAPVSVPVSASMAGPAPVAPPSSSPSAVIKSSGPVAVANQNTVTAIGVAAASTSISTALPAARQAQAAPKGPEGSQNGGGRGASATAAAAPPPKPPQKAPHEQLQQAAAAKSPAQKAVVDKNDPGLPQIEKALKQQAEQKGKTAEVKAQREIAQAIQTAIAAIRAAQQPLPRQVEKTLKDFDTLIAKQKDPLKKEELVKARENYVHVTSGIKNVDPDLRKGPGEGRCPAGICKCRDDFGKDGKPPEITHKEDIEKRFGGKLGDDVTVEEARKHIINTEVAIEILKKTGLEVEQNDDALNKEIENLLKYKDKTYGHDHGGGPCDCGNHFGDSAKGGGGSGQNRPDIPGPDNKNLVALTVDTSGAAKPVKFEP